MINFLFKKLTNGKTVQAVYEADENEDFLPFENFDFKDLIIDFDVSKIVFINEHGNIIKLFK